MHCLQPSLEPFTICLHGMHCLQPSLNLLQSAYTVCTAYSRHWTFYNLPTRYALLTAVTEPLQSAYTVCTAYSRHWTFYNLPTRYALLTAVTEPFTICLHGMHCLQPSLNLLQSAYTVCTAYSRHWTFYNLPTRYALLTAVTEPLQSAYTVCTAYSRHWTFYNLPTQYALLTAVTEPFTICLHGMHCLQPSLSLLQSAYTVCTAYSRHWAITICLHGILFTLYSRHWTFYHLPTGYPLLTAVTEPFTTRLHGMQCLQPSIKQASFLFVLMWPCRSWLTARLKSNCFPFLQDMHVPRPRGFAIPDL